MSEKGFTLSEVLITLGVIGVVAAITLPSVIRKYNEKILLHQFEQAVSIFSQGFMRMANDADGMQNLHGPWNDLRHLNGNFYRNYFKLNKICTGYGNYQKCVPQDFYQIDKKTLINPNNNNGILCSFYTAAAGVLNNGMQFCLAGPLDQKYHFAVDINGTKGPNALGHDYFLFVIEKSGKLSTNDSRIYFCTRKSRNNGIGCSRWVMQHHNLDYLHDLNKGIH